MQEGAASSKEGDADTELEEEDAEMDGVADVVKPRDAVGDEARPKYPARDGSRLRLAKVPKLHSVVLAAASKEAELMVAFRWVRCDHGRQALCRGRGKILMG